MLAEEDSDAPIDSSSSCGQELPVENFLVVVVFSGLGIKKCHRGKGEIIRKLYQPLREFTFCMKSL